MRSPFLAILATLGFLCAALLGFAPPAPTGAQCPTAIVQTVVARDCCGRLVRRAPKPGERAFVQCHCAEKKGATVKATFSTKVEFLLARGATVEIDAPTAAAWLPVAYHASRGEWSEPPGLRPPTAA